MKTDRTWQGVRLRQIEAAPDPDSATRLVRLPVAWDDAAAAALCELAPGTSRVSLPALAQSWILPLSARAKEAGIAGLADRLHALLLHRQGAPGPCIWRGSPGDAPSFVLNLPAFHDPVAGFDVAAFAGAVTTATEALSLLAPHAPRYAVAMADLAGLLAALGLDYASKPARDVACCLAAVLRGRVDAALAGPQLDLLATIPSWPAPPTSTVVPGLAAEAASARSAALRSGNARAGTAILPPGAADALLGIETGGIAPCFAAVGAAGLLRATRAWLSARGISTEAALAAALAGEPIVPLATTADHAAMHDAVAPYLQAMPARPSAVPVPANDTHRTELPARRRGYTQKAAIGGHRVFLRTGEYADGRLGEIDLALPRETAAVRGLADAFATAVSVGLQHGTPLDAYLDALAHARFAPAGVVDGDPGVDRASSIPDYVVRSLAASYLGRVVPADQTEPVSQPQEPPMLPLDLPPSRRRANLRVVAA
jgi:ribonucleoside-diphosphate reductase alpha chain